MTAMLRAAGTTKERILDAAFAEFSDHGFAGARVDRIADRAGANKALLYQHFGDKEALFRTVLERKLEALSALRHDPERLPEAAGEFFDFHAANRWASKLMMWEALDFGTAPVPNEAQRKDKLRAHVAQIEEAQRSGHVDPSLDPAHTLMTLMATIVFWFAAPQAARMICGGDPYTPAALAARRAHVVEMARRILEVR